MKMRPRRYRSTYSQNVLEQTVVNSVVVAAVVLVCKRSKVSKPLIKLVCNRQFFDVKNILCLIFCLFIPAASFVLLNYINSLLQQGLLSFHDRV